MSVGFLFWCLDYQPQMKYFRIPFLLLPPILILLFYGIWIELNKLELTHLQMQDTGIARVLRGKTMLHISDLHIGKIGNREKEILKFIEDSKPDLILLTGDYVSWEGDYEPALEFLSKLKAELGVWAVMGDYDYSNSRKSCLFCHEQGSGKQARRHKAKFIRNSTERIEVEGQSVWIGGFDKENNGPFAYREGLVSFLEKDPGILLSHSPLVFDYIDKNHNVLVLAGDTHGGQIPLPAWLWRILGYEKNARYNQGWFKEGKKRMYVTRGIGMSHWPLRILRRPELVVLHF